MPTVTENQTDRISSLDGLRAVSIVIVVFSHLWYSRGFPDSFFLTGNLGVRIFFIISGFLITSILLAELRKTSTLSLRKFYFRRTFRIFPAYYFYLGAIYFAQNISGNQTSQIFLSSLSYTSDYIFPPGNSPLQHTWSLAVEEQFYLIFPVVLAFFGLLNFKRFIFLALFLAPLLRAATYVFSASFDNYQFLTVAWNFHTNVDVLASGCLLAVYRTELHKKKYYRYFLGSPLIFSSCLAAVITLAIYAENFLLLFYLFGITAINLLIVGCIDWLIFNRQSQAGKFLNLRPVRFVGVLSYSIYLWQQPFSFYVKDMWWTHFPLNLILLSFFSLFSYYLIEKVFLQYRQILEKRFAGEDRDLILSGINN